MNQLDAVKTKLDEMKERYPIFVEYWVKFLKMRELSFIKSIKNCEKAIELMKKNKMDLTPESIFLFLILINEV